MGGDSICMGFRLAGDQEVASAHEAFRFANHWATSIKVDLESESAPINKAGASGNPK